MTHLQNSEYESSYLKEFFSKQWKIYQKVLNNNYMGHREIYSILHELLVSYFQKPFKILDLGCGDASFISLALLNTNIASYHGIDLSIPALEIAKENLAKIHCDTTLTQVQPLPLLRGKCGSDCLRWAERHRLQPYITCIIFNMLN
ncbi:class I SAM-dependent methyltransferase [Anabaena sp. CCY 9402-a]|uniref:class I SAM-dependent methyltransferase n=1 Tax=Anabaena sp. CCY 9402-a TaxID=3103867 RepID=UPI0039C668DF